MTKIISLDNFDDFNNKAAEIIENSIKDLLNNQDSVVFGIPGGRSVAGIFNQLKEKGIEWKKVHIFMVDERLVDLSDPQSNFKLAKENFIDELLEKELLPWENVHPFIVGKNYDIEFKKKKYDIVLLSSGEDGHVGALFPNHNSIRNDSESFIIIEDSPKLPRNRMGASRRFLEKSKIAVLLFLGNLKKKAYNKFMDKDTDINSCPAKIVLGIKDSYVLTCFNN